MSAERTNIDTQAKRHSPSLIGMGLTVAFAGLLFLGFLYVTTTPDVDEIDALVTSPAEETS